MDLQNWNNTIHKGTQWYAYCVNIKLFCENKIDVSIQLNLNNPGSIPGILT